MYTKVPTNHSSEIKGFCAMKYSREMLQIFCDTFVYGFMFSPNEYPISLGHFIKHKRTSLISEEWYFNSWVDCKKDSDHFLWYIHKRRNGDVQCTREIVIETIISRKILMKKYFYIVQCAYLLSPALLLKWFFRIFFMFNTEIV